MSWEPTEEAWQYELLDRLKPGVDITQLERNLRMTPTERLELVRHLAQFAAEVRRSRDRLSKAP